jgi:hypothetical protein
MLDQLYIVFEDSEFDSFSLKHIQYNILKRIKQLKYVTYRRIDFLFAIGTDSLMVERDDRKTAVVKCFADRSIVETIEAKDTIAGVYSKILNGLKLLWERNKWDKRGLEDIYNEIIKEDYFSSIIYGKVYVSPDKKYKAYFLCEIFPGFADYFLVFMGAKGMLHRKIKFLHGHSDPSIFFTFFNNQSWRDSDHFLLSNNNKEVFYIFNVKSDNFSIEYRPIYNSLQECQNFVAAFQSHTSNSEMMRLLGFPK